MLHHPVKVRKMLLVEKQKIYGNNAEANADCQCIDCPGKLDDAEISRVRDSEGLKSRLKPMKQMKSQKHKRNDINNGHNRLLKQIYRHGIKVMSVQGGGRQRHKANFHKKEMVKMN